MVLFLSPPALNSLREATELNIPFGPCFSLNEDGMGYVITFQWIISDFSTKARRSLEPHGAWGPALSLYI
jgi:hypothetical protein